MTIGALLRDIDNYYLPAIQREFVWESGKIEMLFDSLLREYPIGSFLLWEVRKPDIHDKFTFYDLIRDFDVRKPHNVKVDLGYKDRIMGILDGQQRITSLVIGLMGSYREKIAWKRWSNPDAFPIKRLYMNLLFEPSSPDADQQFQIKFLTDAQAAQNKDGVYWFRIGHILPASSKQELRDLRRKLPCGDNPRVEDHLDILWSAIHERDNISYFLETREDLDTVLNIFVRLNRGGTPLSYSDLLLSLATATWGSHDARQEVYGLVEYLNKQCGAPFNFSKDFVLKALLVMNDGDVRFKTENISKKRELEKTWPHVQKSLKLTAKLLALFGFDMDTLTANTAVIPIAYYLSKKGYDESFLTHKANADDREEIRLWLLRILLARVFRGQTDQLLTLIRNEIRDAVSSQSGTKGFPAQRIEDMLRTRRAYSFSTEDIERIVDETVYGDPYVFSTLALLFPHLSYHHTRFHIDHMHPSSIFTKKNLTNAGLDAPAIAYALERYNRLPNLQLLTEAVNEAKKAKPLADWFASVNQVEYRATNLIPDINLSLGNFREFYEARRLLLIDQLRTKLGISSNPVVVNESLPVDELITGENADVDDRVEAQPLPEEVFA